MRLLLALAIACFLLIRPATAQQPSPIAVSGDHTPWFAVLDKARRKETITIVGLGGSITACAGASTPASCWLNRTAAWFTERYGVTVNLVNAGAGGTDSVYGSLRFK